MELNQEREKRFKKEIKIASKGNYFSKEKLLNEFSKCDLVCANCHRERTWKRKNGGQCIESNAHRPFGTVNFSRVVGQTNIPPTIHKIFCCYLKTYRYRQVIQGANLLSLAYGISPDDQRVAIYSSLQATKSGGIDGRCAHLIFVDNEVIPLFIFYPINWSRHSCACLCRIFPAGLRPTSCRKILPINFFVPSPRHVRLTDIFCFRPE